MPKPHISIIIATRDRAEPLRVLLASLAALAPPSDEILIVDQSKDDATACLLRETNSLAGLRYFRQQATGLSRARNLGAAEAAGDILAFTDDDCEVAPDFIAAIRTVVDRIPEAGVFFGQVDPGSHDATRGLVPSSGRDDDFVARSTSDHLQLGGMGACMVVRRECLMRLGGFDIQLGAGARFPAAEETDIALRALGQGIPVVESPVMRVTHHGFRTWQELDSLSDNYLRGTGAMFSKRMRLRPMETAFLLFSVLSRWAVGKPRIRYINTPRRLARLRAFAQGLSQGMRLPLNHAWETFRDDGM
jgi:GT2 family glycosyltransferase